ncbi:MAG: PAS domain S-box protein, partial [Desulfatitalea sp.]|nr:PAS domain S-box protein [Desulfatitalea sp.]
MNNSENLLRHLLDISPLSMSIVHLNDGCYLYVNPAFCQNTGYSAKEIIGRTEADLHLYVDPNERRHLIAQLLRHGRTEHTDITFRARDGRRYSSHISARTVEFEGQPGVLSVTTFADPLKKAHCALAESENRFRTILQSIAEGYYEVDLPGNITFFNRAAQQIMGYPKETLLGLNYRDYVTPDTAEQIYQAYNAVFKTGSPSQTVEYTIVRKDGTVVMVETSISLKRDPMGRPIGFYGIVRDRTAQKRAEEALRQSEESYRSLLDLAPDAITVTRMADGRYFQVNDAFCRKTGYAMQEVMGRTPSDLNLYVDPRDRDRIVEQLRRDGRVDGMEITFRMKDGRHLDHLVSAQPMLFKGHDCLLIMAKDITPLKNAQQSLRLSEEKYRTILETMEEGYYEVDLSGNYTFFNAASRNLHGYSDEALLGMNYRNYLSQDKVQEIRAIYSEIYRTGISSNILDHTIRRPDGSERMVEMSAYPMRDASGLIVGFWGISRDRTERKQAEMALQESEARLRLIFDNANEGIYILLDECIRFPNPRTKTICGFSRQELVGMRFIDLVLPEDREILYSEQLRKL